VTVHNSARPGAAPLDRGIFSGRTALVTGAAGGIGSAIARALAARGADLILVDADRRVGELADRLGGYAMSGDLRDPAVTDQALTAEGKRSGRLDMLVNAAGIQLRVGAVDVAEEDWERLVAVNLSAAYRLCRAAAPHLAATRGSIVNISSLSADRAVAGIVPYGATKAALSQLTKGLAVELGPLGVRVNAVAPGYVHTPMTEELLDQADVRNRVLSRIPLGRLADGADIADPVVFLLSDAARYITGAVLPVDGGYSIT
jgi:NAD(P)-dependent dehydrogenase (short-subunit alcohol dehydrogenase family)